MRTSPLNQNVHKRMFTNDNEFDCSAIRQYVHVDVGSFSLMCEEALKLFILVGWDRSFVCCLVHRGSTDYLLLLQIFSGVV